MNARILAFGILGLASCTPEQGHTAGGRSGSTQSEIQQVIVDFLAERYQRCSDGIHYTIEGPSRMRDGPQFREAIAQRLDVRFAAQPLSEAEGLNGVEFRYAVYAECNAWRYAGDSEWRECDPTGMYPMFIFTAVKQRGAWTAEEKRYRQHPERLAPGTVFCESQIPLSEGLNLREESGRFR